MLRRRGRPVSGPAGAVPFRCRLPRAAAPPQGRPRTRSRRCAGFRGPGAARRAASDRSATGRWGRVWVFWGACWTPVPPLPWGQGAERPWAVVRIRGRGPGASPGRGAPRAGGLGAWACRCWGGGGAARASRAGGAPPGAARPRGVGAGRGGGPRGGGGAGGGGGGARGAAGGRPGRALPPRAPGRRARPAVAPAVRRGGVARAPGGAAGPPHRGGPARRARRAVVVPPAPIARTPVAIASTPRIALPRPVKAAPRALRAEVNPSDDRAWRFRDVRNRRAGAGSRLRRIDTLYCEISERSIRASLRPVLRAPRACHPQTPAGGAGPPRARAAGTRSWGTAKRSRAVVEALMQAGPPRARSARASAQRRGAAAAPPETAAALCEQLAARLWQDPAEAAPVAIKIWSLVLAGERKVGAPGGHGCALAPRTRQLPGRLGRGLPWRRPPPPPPPQNVSAPALLRPSFLSSARGGAQGWGHRVAGGGPGRQQPCWPCCCSRRRAPRAQRARCARRAQRRRPRDGAAARGDGRARGARGLRRPLAGGGRATGGCRCGYRPSAGRARARAGSSRRARGAGRARRRAARGGAAHRGRCTRAAPRGAAVGGGGAGAGGRVGSRQQRRGRRGGGRGRAERAAGAGRRHRRRRRPRYRRRRRRRPRPAAARGGARAQGAHRAWRGRRRGGRGSHAAG
jgi:hypothetical protein